MEEGTPPPKPKAPPPLPPRPAGAAGPAPHVPHVPQGPHVPQQPMAPQPQPHSAMHEDDDIGIYQHDRKLVVELGATIPPYCVRCGRPAQHRVYKRYAMSFSGNAKIDIPLCDAHLSVRRGLRVACWSMFLLSIVILYFAIAKENGPLGWTGAALLTASLVVGVFSSNYLGIASRIDRDYVWIKGLSVSFLNRLPPFV